MDLHCQCQVHKLCFGKELFTYMCIYAYICTYSRRAFFSPPKHGLRIGIGICKLDFFQNGAHGVLEKSSSYRVHAPHVCHEPTVAMTTEKQTNCRKKACRLFACLGFIFRQHLRSYQGGYRLMRIAFIATL